MLVRLSMMDLAYIAFPPIRAEREMMLRILRFVRDVSELSPSSLATLEGHIATLEEELEGSVQ